MYSLSWLYVTAHLAKAQDSVVGDGACQQECEAAYADPTMIDLCNTACLEQPELFHVDFPYIFGPLTVQPYPNLTNADPTELEDLTGTLWARVNVDRNRMQFMYEMDSNPEPFFPYFAMHLHQGNLNAEEIGGHIIVSIAGQGSSEMADMHTKTRCCGSFPLIFLKCFVSFYQATLLVVSFQLHKEETDHPTFSCAAKSARWAPRIGEIVSTLA